MKGVDMIESKDDRLASIDLIAIPYLRVAPTRNHCLFLITPPLTQHIHPTTQNQKELKGVGFD